MKFDPVASRFRFVIVILAAVVGAGAPGCSEVSGWGNLFGENRQKSPPTRKVTSEPQSYVVTEPAEDPDSTSAELVEARINDYVDHYRERDEPPKEVPVTELAAAQNPSAAPESQMSASGIEPSHEPVGANSAADQVPESIARVETGPDLPPSMSISTNDAHRESVVPEHEQEAPVLLSVSVEPDFLSGPTMNQELNPSDNAEANRGARVAMQTSANDIDAVVRRLETRVAERPNDLAAQLRLKLLYLVQGREQEAVAPPQGLADDVASLIRTVAEALVETQRALVDLQSGADPALARVVALADELRAHADLEIPHVVLCKRVDSYGQYTPIEPSTFAPGSPISAVIYVELSNFQSAENESGFFETRLSQRIELLDATGRRIWQRQDGEIVDVCRNRRRDFFLSPIVHLPSETPPGEYRLRVEVEDLNANKIASGTTDLMIGDSGPSESAARLFGQSSATASIPATRTDAMRTPATELSRSEE